MKENSIENRQQSITEAIELCSLLDFYESTDELVNDGRTLGDYKRDYKRLMEIINSGITLKEISIDQDKLEKFRSMANSDQKDLE